MCLSYFIKCEFQREYPPLYNQTISNSNFPDPGSPSTIAWWVWVLPTEFLATRLEVHAGMIRYQSFLSMVSLRTSCKRPKFPDEFHRNPDVFPIWKLPRKWTDSVSHLDNLGRAAQWPQVREEIVLGFLDFTLDSEVLLCLIFGI